MATINHRTQEFHDEAMDDDSSNYSESTDVHLTEQEKHDLEKMRILTNPGHHKIYKTYNVVNNLTNKIIRKTKKINIYSTRNTPGARIRDPIHGTFSNDKVGSKDEYYYFKVRLASLISNTNDPVTLFYDSPESYERHQLMRVNMDIKNKWHIRHNAHTGYVRPRAEGGRIVVK